MESGRKPPDSRDLQTPSAKANRRQDKSAAKTVKRQEGGGGVYSYSMDTIEGPRAPAVKLNRQKLAPRPKRAENHLWTPTEDDLLRAQLDHYAGAVIKWQEILAKFQAIANLELEARRISLTAGALGPSILSAEYRDE